MALEHVAASRDLRLSNRPLVGGQSINRSHDEMFVTPTENTSRLRTTDIQDLFGTLHSNRVRQIK